MSKDDPVSKRNKLSDHDTHMNESNPLDMQEEYHLNNNEDQHHNKHENNDNKHETNDQDKHEYQHEDKHSNNDNKHEDDIGISDEEFKQDEYKQSNEDNHIEDKQPDEEDLLKNKQPSEGNHSVNKQLGEENHLEDEQLGEESHWENNQLNGRNYSEEGQPGEIDYSENRHHSEKNGLEQAGDMLSEYTIKQELEDIYPSEHSAMSSEKADSSPEPIYDTYSFDPKLQEFLPKERKESAAMKEEREGKIRAQPVLNDGRRESMIILTGLKNVFQKQLPEMPKDYIARLVYDRNHRSIALIRNPNKVIGGICYRPFDLQEFAEIVFCAIASTEQVKVIIRRIIHVNLQKKGYGSFIMNHLKDYVSSHSAVKYFLTYADNFAMGYFRKQGFTAELTLDKRKWVGFMKDYEGSTIMQCSIMPQVKYLELHEILGIQRNAILKKMKEKTIDHVFPGIHISQGGSIDPLTVPGISESGWSPEMDMISNIPRHVAHYHEMLFLVEEMQNYTHAWPFLEPVKVEDVADYYQIIKEPMDLTTLEENVKADAYPTMEDFVKDTNKIFTNCKTYNAQDTEYSKCAVKLEKYFNEKLRSISQ
ncbi:hypothetical protein G6F56_007800 [Rhizopus delemar]|nr:hypothetical protein G6F56_007800 [Rhizopus delemar]